MKWRRETGLIPSRRTPGRPGSELTVALVSSDRIVPARIVEPQTADGYLRLTAHLLLEAERNGIRTFGVLSANRGEGKTTAAVNLAAGLGRARGREGRVLLVDGDTRQRTLTRLLAGERGARSGKALLIATAFEGVDFLAAPDFGPAAAIHAPSAWLKTLQALSLRYPQVVVDCPAVQADPEAIVLRECVEALVLVAHAGRATRATLARTVGHLGRRVVGVVLNGATGSAVAPSGSPA